jgi:hypothetical protein
MALVGDADRRLGTRRAEHEQYQPGRAERPCITVLEQVSLSQRAQGNAVILFHVVVPDGRGVDEAMPRTKIIDR